MGKNKLGMLIYSLVLIVISALITTYIITNYYYNSSSSAGADNGIQAFTEMSADKIASSPIKGDRDVIEIFSYGCHYCASYDNDVSKLASQLPEGSRLIRLHIDMPRNGLARYAPVFATLSVMGLEDKYRESAYYAVLMKKIDLSVDAQLDEWLKSNQIDVDAYHKTRNSQEVADLLKYMQNVSSHYDIKATPMFIVAKKWVIIREGSASEFNAKVLDLLKQK